MNFCFSRTHTYEKYRITKHESDAVVVYIVLCYYFSFNGPIDIAGFHCHTIIKTIEQIQSRIKEIKEDEYSNSLAKIQVCAMFRAGDIRRNDSLKFIRLCMKTPCLCPSEGHKYGGRKLTKTYVIEFCNKKPVVLL